VVDAAGTGSRFAPLTPFPATLCSGVEDRDILLGPTPVTDELTDEGLAWLATGLELDNRDTCVSISIFKEISTPAGATR